MRHPLPTLLALAVCAMLCGAHGLYTINQSRAWTKGWTDFPSWAPSTA